MIRINLLATETARAARRTKPSGLQLEQKVRLLCSLLLVVTALGIGWWWWSLSQASARLETELANAERETARLQTIIQQVDQFERQRQQLQQRVSLIEELRKGQSGPVHLLDEVSHAMPDMLWLTDLKQESSGELTLDGRCTTLTALSDFVGNLEGSSFFVRPVDIVNSQLTPGSAGAPDLIAFSIKAKFAMPGAAASAGQPQGAAVQQRAAAGAR